MSSMLLLIVLLELGTVVRCLMLSRRRDEVLWAVWSVLPGLLAVRQIFVWNTLAGREPWPGGVFALAAEMVVAAGLLLTSLLPQRAVPRTRAEEEASRKLLEIFRASSDAFILTEPSEGRILDVNEGFSHLSGWSREEALGKTTYELQMWADSSDRERLLRTLMEGGGRGEMEAAMRHRSGDVRHSMITGAIVRLGGEPRLLAIARDVTETLAAKAALRDSQRSFMAAFHGSPNMIIINTFPEGRVIEVNEAAERLTGFRREELIGRTTLDLEVWGSIEDRQRMMAALESDGKIHDMEISFLTCSGEYRPAILSSSVIEFRGEPCLISTVQDISELKRAAEEREAFVHELEMKNEELERFTYTVSHDLKSPLVTIRGFLGFVEKAALARDEERLKQDLDRIRGATETMRRLLDELLELSRIGRQLNPPEDIDLCELVGEALSYLEEPIAERGIEVVVEDLPVVQGDRPRLLEVWQNLLENAVKFTRSAERPRMEVASRRDGDETVLYVRDNGDGIEPVYLEKIFGLFERLDPDVDGTGVGLALVKRIVEVHGGRVWAESEGPGAGTTFCLTLGSMTA